MAKKKLYLNHRPSLEDWHEEKHKFHVTKRLYHTLHTEYVHPIDKELERVLGKRLRKGRLVATTPIAVYLLYKLRKRRKER